MRSLEESRLRWQVTTKHVTSLEDLKKSVRVDGDENPSKAGLRSVCWKIFLLFEGTEVTGWSRALVDSRSAYTSLQEHFLRFIENPDEIGSALDPLDDDKSSPWNTLRQDEEMRAEIFQDVERCMPEEPYFREPRIQRFMLDILFIFCKINQDVGYRQGMHELLAPILWVVEQDAIDYGNNGDQNSGPREDALLKQMLDLAYIENDAFTLFSLIMRSAKSFYELAEPDRRSSGTASPQHGASPIVERSKRIHEVYLARLDPDVAKHLTDIEVLPQIFLIRWVRLLFGREFPFDDLLALWDILLAEDPALDLVDMVCVAMILRIRWQLIEANYSMALMLLLKYPSPVFPNGPQTFVDDAIYLRDNFSAAGGATIISKYGEPTPPNQSDSRSATPLGQVISSRQKLYRNKPPLPSPARFLQQQGGIEALFQGATKGVLERGEKLGINQAVRDAVGEVRKNVQGFQAARAGSASRRTSDVTRWSLDEGRPVPPSKAMILSMNKRNRQLAQMLNQAMSDLRSVSVSEGGDKDKYIQAMDLAISKVDFVKIYLEDSSMPLPSEIAEDTATTDSTQRATPSAVSHPPPSPSPKILHTPQADLETETPAKALDLSLPSTPIRNLESKEEKQSMGDSSAAPPKAPEVVADKPEPAAGAQLLSRPSAPVPTRSSIAQSSFSWMLESDSTPPTMSGKLSPPNSSSPFPKSGRRPTAGAGREKAAFLFGDDGEDMPLTNTKLASLVGGDDEGFKLGTMRGSPGPQE